MREALANWARRSGPVPVVSEKPRELSCREAICRIPGQEKPMVIANALDGLTCFLSDDVIPLFGSMPTPASLRKGQGWPSNGCGRGQNWASLS
jgi:hypothetical protein